MDNTNTTYKVYVYKKWIADCDTYKQVHDVINKNAMRGGMSVQAIDD